MDSYNIALTQEDAVPSIATAEPIENNVNNTTQDENDVTGIPTIHLSSRAEVLSDIIAVDAAGESDECHTAQTVAQQVSMSVRDAYLEIGNSTRNTIYWDLSTARAEWISARLWKGTANVPTGLKITPDLKIGFIEAGSLISETPFQVGDTLFSINNKHCNEMGAEASAVLLRNSSGHVTVVVHNKDGFSDLVESMASKQLPSDSCGVVLKATSSSASRRIVIARIKSSAMFANSLLNPDDEVIKINGISCEHLDVNEAANIIKGARSTVSILTKTSGQTGVVVAEVLSDATGPTSYSATPGPSSSYTPIYTAPTLATRTIPTAATETRPSQAPSGSTKSSKVSASVCLVLAAFAITFMIVGSTLEDPDGGEDTYSYNPFEDDFFNNGLWLDDDDSNATTIHPSVGDDFASFNSSSTGFFYP